VSTRRNPADQVATITPHRNGTATVSGLSHGDLRLIARAIEEGSFAAGDRGGDVSRALLRFAHLLRVPAHHPTLFSPVRLTCARSNGADLYEELP
jgi:hypothetical protein